MPTDVGPRVLPTRGHQHLKNNIVKVRIPYKRYETYIRQAYKVNKPRLKAPILFILQEGRAPHRKTKTTFPLSVGP